MTKQAELVSELHTLALKYDESAAHAYSIESAIERRRAAQQLRFTAIAAPLGDDTATLRVLADWLREGLGMLERYDLADIDALHAASQARRS